MEAEPPKLGYARATRTQRVGFFRILDFTFHAVFGLCFLIVGVMNLIALLQWREGSRTANAFIGTVGVLAGFAFFVRPIYRMCRDGELNPSQ